MKNIDSLIEKLKIQIKAAKETGRYGDALLYTEIVDWMEQNKFAPVGYFDVYGTDENPSYIQIYSRYADDTTVQLYKRVDK